MRAFKTDMHFLFFVKIFDLLKRMRGKSGCCCGCWLLSALLFNFISVPMAQAGDRFIIKPMVITAYGIDSNFYRVHKKERSVSTSTISPGLEFGYRTEKSKVAVKGMLNFVYYDDLNSVPSGKADSDGNNYTGHWLTLFADTKLFTRISLGVDDTWINTRNPTELDRFDNFTDIDEYMINRMRPWLKYRITDRISLGLEFQNTKIDYNASYLEDSDNTGEKLSLYYEINKFTTINLESGFKQMNYDKDSSDYDSSEYRINVVNQFKYFQISGGLGYHQVQFDTPGLSDIETVSWGLSVKGQNPPPGDSSGDLPRSYIDLDFAQNFNDTGTGDEYYRADRLRLILGHLFMEKIDVKLDTYYQKSAYENSASNRNDDTYYLSGIVTYYINDWLLFNLKLGFETRNSSIAENSYDNTFVMFRITFNYNLASR